MTPPVANAITLDTTEVAATDVDTTDVDAPDDPVARPPVLLRLDDVEVTYRSLPRARRGGWRRPRLLQRRVPVRAVNKVTLRVRAGEALGVVGRNGSGKTSLLRAAAGLQPLSSGQVLAASQPMLLGIGAVLKPHLSGWENIELGLLALGLQPAEADEMADEVAAFSDIGTALDRPMMTLSSGMRARLNFSIATAIRPQLLFVDEALAAGDVEFRQRSEDRMRELLANAGAVVLVSHSGPMIRRLSTRAVWLDQGRIVADGTPDEIVAAYETAVTNQDETGA